MLNDYGKIPKPLFIFRDGRRMLYVKRGKRHIMHKFGEAVGISVAVLNKVSPRMDIMVEIDIDGQLEYFICKVHRFLESTMIHMNNEIDEQRFVPVKDMIPYRGRRWW